MAVNIIQKTNTIKNVLGMEYIIDPSHCTRCDWIDYLYVKFFNSRQGNEEMRSGTVKNSSGVRN